MTSKQLRLKLRAMGQRIKKCREEAGLTQLELSKLVKIDRGDISRIEHGLKDLKVTTLSKLARALKVETKDFFQDS